ncbi:MAG: hypothetical protein SGI88_16550 [Candidatus Hydrogenedentes bacterium]|nr:hypothetical protein [Candidatus Hydrogenedentota bacterium]
MGEELGTLEFFLHNPKQLALIAGICSVCFIIGLLYSKGSARTKYRMEVAALIMFSGLMTITALNMGLWYLKTFEMEADIQEVSQYLDKRVPMWVAGMRGIFLLFGLGFSVIAMVSWWFLYRHFYTRRPQ